MAERRRSNSELNLDRIAEEEARRKPRKGILEIFKKPPKKPDEDAPLSRDDEHE